MKFTSDRVGGQENAKRGNLWDGVQSEKEGHMLLSHWWVLIAHICGTEMVLGVEDNKEEFCGLVLWWGGCARRAGKGDYADISKVWYLRCKKPYTGSLCQGSSKPRT